MTATRAPYAVLFDLDGTLVDSIGLLVASMEHAFADRTRRPPVHEWVAAIGTPLDAMIRPYAEDEADLLHLRGRYREYQVANHDAQTAAYPGVVKVVRALHAAGHRLAVVTSKLEEGARRSLRHIGVEECFGAVVGIDATERHKPEPEPVWHALSLIGGRRERAIFVGDSTHDMLAGRAAGVVTGAALWGPFSRAQLETTAPDHWFARIGEVPAVVEALRRRGGLDTG
ncbi:MAG: HAD-IA family hydrolase [Gemmatimonadaceae bacterium]